MSSLSVNNKAGVLHVFPYEESWALVDENTNKTVCLFSEPEEALKAARKVVKKNSYEHITIHDLHGSIVNHI